MNKFYFHIGFPKTGTSYLQKNFYPLLKLKYMGKHYSSSIDNKDSSKDFEAQLRKIFTFQPYNISKDYINELYSFFNENEKILYSNEDLSGSYHIGFLNFPQICQNIKKIFPNAKLIIIIRKQDDFIESIYRQSIRSGTWINIKKFINFKNNQFNNFRLNYKSNISLDNLNYFDLITFLHSLFGESNILVLPYEEFKFDKKNFLLKTSNLLDVDYVEPYSSELANKSDSWLTLQFMRFFNILLYKKNQNAINKVLFFNKTKQLTNIFMRKKKFTNKELNKNIFNYYKKSNEALDKKLSLNLKEYGYY